MKEIRNILGWLGMAEEQSILRDAQKHVEETHKTVTYFAEAVKAFIKGDLTAKTDAIENVRESEHQADLLRSKMVSELSESLLLPPDREDLMHFVKSLDRIADWTNGAARVLGFIEHKLPENVLTNISASTGLIVNSISKLKDGIAALTKNDLKKALQDCEDVDRLEHEADDYKKTLIESMIHAKLEPITFFLCYQLAEYLEGVTDKIEDAADLIKVVAIKSK
ncbi:MAG: TIGR00153 family protein [Candidatus Omnitrophica bacterium]|nr:TIGR00153 family protein [Candidatus Omnitrophota bacterium]